MALIASTAGNVALTMGAGATGQLKSLQKTVQQEPVIQARDVEHEAEGKEGVGKPGGGAGEAHGSTETQQQQQSQNQQKAQQRQISLQNEQYQIAQSTHKAQQGEETEETTQQLWNPQNGAAEGKPTKYSFDTSGMIRLRFEQAKHTDGTQQTAQNPATQKEKFLQNLYRQVRTEYEQFVKSDDNTYTRKNLRDIMGALMQDRNFTNKDDKRLTERDGWVFRETEAKEGVGYNKLNQLKLTRTFSQMQQYQEEPPKDQLSLVA